MHHSDKHKKPHLAGNQVNKNNELKLVILIRIKLEADRAQFFRARAKLDLEVLSQDEPEFVQISLEPASSASFS